MKIAVINPNSTAAMTAAIGDCARRVAALGTTIVASNPTNGPPALEGWCDEALAVPGMLAELTASERAGCDAYVIACFGDPGLFAARELVRGPVLGIAEAAMHAASLIAPGFSVVTTLARTRGMAWHLAERYGMRRFCRSVRATDIPVLALGEPGSEALRLIIDQCRRAIAEDGAEAIVLGCAGMAQLADDISAHVGVPVVEGVAAAVKFAEGLVSLGLATAKHGEFAAPETATRGDAATAGAVR